MNYVSDMDVLGDLEEAGEDIINIESVILNIKQSENRILFYKTLKKKRIKPLDSQIKKEEEKINNMKSSVLNCMKINGEKVLKFPGVANVSVSNRKGTWTIEDEKALALKLKEENLFLEAGGEDITKFNKTKLNKILNEYEKNNNIPEEAHREESSDIISISYDKSTESNIHMFNEESYENKTEDNNVKNTEISSMDISLLDGVDF